MFKEISLSPTRQLSPTDVIAAAALPRDLLKRLRESIQQHGKLIFENSLTKVEDGVSETSKSLRWKAQGSGAVLQIAPLSRDMVDPTKALMSLMMLLEQLSVGC